MRRHTQLCNVCGLSQGQLGAREQALYAVVNAGIASKKRAKWYELDVAETAAMLHMGKLEVQPSSLCKPNAI